MKKQSPFGSLAFEISVLLLCSLSLSAQNNSSPRPTVRHAASFGISMSLRELAKLPQYVLRTNELVPQSQRQPLGAVVDTVRQSIEGSGQNFSININGPGLGSGFSGFTPTVNYPDDNIAVGSTQIVQVVNNSMAVFDKNLNALTTAIPIAQLLGEIGGACADGIPEGHPIAQYDRMAGQWLIAENVVSGPPYVSTACIGVSQTSDATASYYLYQFSLHPGYQDLPKWAIWPTGFFQSSDNFGPKGMSFLGAYPCTYDRDKMLVGDSSAEQVCFRLSSNDFALQPADLDSSTTPPAGQDEFLFSLWDSSDLALYSINIDWSNPGGATITGANGSQLFAVPAFTPACNGLGVGACVPQLNTNVMLDVLGDRLLYRVAYSNDVPPQVPKTALPAHLQHWLVMHDVTASGGNTAERWYEFYSSTKTTQVTNIKLLQSGTYAPDSTNHRWMGSIARDMDSNILMGYSESSTSIYPSIYITGRTLNDSPGTMEDELSVVAGSGAYLGVFDFSLYRWGDYTSMRLDPTDNCTFWYTNEYYTASGISNWSTQINSAKFAGCGG